LVAYAISARVAVEYISAQKGFPKEALLITLFQKLPSAVHKPLVKRRKTNKSLKSLLVIFFS
jgi:hypothetical protein